MLTALPEAMAYGVLVFSALGPEQASRGLAAGILGLVFLNLGGALFGSIPVLASSPFSLTTLMLAAAVPSLRGLVPEGSGGEGAVVGLLLAAALLAGLLQAAMGAARLGSLGKFVPYPVIAGLTNGTAILIVLGQLPILFEGAELLSPGDIKWLNLAVGAVTALVAWHGLPGLRAVPAPVAALAAGTAAYYAVDLLGGGASLGATIGAIPSSVPTPAPLFEMARAAVEAPAGPLAAELGPLALGLAVVASIGTLVATISADAVTGDRSDTSRELVAQGLGNAMAAAFGGIPGAGSASRTVANHRYGGRTRWSRLVMALFALGVLVLLHPVVALIPRVVLAALLVVLALGLVDRWLFDIARRALGGADQLYRLGLIDLGVSLLVTAVLLAVGVIEAVAVGLLLSVVYFAVRMGQGIVRRRYGAHELHSSIQRNAEEFSLLEAEGSRIQVLELQGSIFFGTADRLAALIDELSEQRVVWIVLDLSRVAELDSSGARILVQSARRASQAGVGLALSAPPGSGVARVLLSMGVADAVGRERLFAAVNDALGWAEDGLLDRVLGSDRHGRELDPGGIDALGALSPDELRLVSSRLDRRSYADGEALFRQGERGDAIFLLVRGRARVEQRSPGAPPRRLATLCPGTLLGEMSASDGRPRSASVFAEGVVVCLVLSVDDLDLLATRRPEIARKLMAGIARELSTRLRIANRTVQ